MKVTSLLTFAIASSTANAALDLPNLFNAAKDFFGLNTNRVDASLEHETKIPAYHTDIDVADYSAEGLPKVRLGGRVADLFHGWHFDDIMQDTPDEIRPASLVIFYNSSDAQCMEKYNAIGYDNIAETKLPARSQLFTARYDMYAAPVRAWYEFTPEMDLQKRFGVTECPQVVFTSRKCDGFTEWCKRGKDPEDPALEVLGCENYKEHCTPDKRAVFPLGKSSSHIAKQESQLVDWVNDQINRDGRPKLSHFLGSYAEQGRWMQKRDYTSHDNHFRNVYLAQAFPAFTKRGFKAIETPKEVQEWLLQFVKDYEKFRKTENWHAESTQMSFHEKPTTFIDMDMVRRKKEQMAKEFLQPILEEWSNLNKLELTAFYGMREYHENAWLKQHVDRIDTHVISITLSVAKRNFDFDVNGTFPYKPWPLVVTDWTGKQISYDHPPGTMVLYESSKLPHGRTFRNEGGVHLGCFVHFKPINMHGSEAKIWDGITAKARKNQAIHTEHRVWKSTEEVEPESPEFAEQNVGQASIWQKIPAKANPGKGAQGEDNSGYAKANEQIPVEFKNRSDRTLEVFWYHPGNKIPVSQGKIWPGASFSINTFHGHIFYWAEPGTTEPIQDGKFTIDTGKRLYEYKLKRDGSAYKEVSPYAESVKQKIVEEDAMLQKLKPAKTEL